MKIAVLGAGAGGTAVAFDCAAQGHEVRLFDFPEFRENIQFIARQGGIVADGDISGFGDIAYAGHDIDEVLEDVELVDEHVRVATLSSCWCGWSWEVPRMQTWQWWWNAGKPRRTVADRALNTPKLLGGWFSTRALCRA